MAKYQILPLVVAFLLFSGSAQGQPLKAKAGAYYFDGWTGKTYHLTDRLKNEFFDREPVWGWTDASQEVMERQIDYAADNGLSFFSFDWYYPEGTEKETPLNASLGLYLKAGNKSRLQFCLMVANHSGFRIGPEEWETVTNAWIPLFKEPTYVTLNGEPLIIFFAPWELYWKFGASPEGVKSAFERLREKARAAGLPGVAIAGCFQAGPQPPGITIDLSILAASGYTCLTGYNYAGVGVKGTERIQPFSNLIPGHEEIWNKFAAESSIPYIPVVTAGWDMRPWEAPDLPLEKRSVYYPDRTPPQVGAFVERAIQWLDAHPDKTPKERLLLIYAWNENGEGGYLTPTKSQGDALLKAINKVLK